MIDFELSKSCKSIRDMTHQAAEHMMRPISRETDENEHDKPWEFINAMWEVSRGTTMVGGTDADDKADAKAAGPKAAALSKTPSWGLMRKLRRAP